MSSFLQWLAEFATSLSKEVNGGSLTKEEASQRIQDAVEENQREKDEGRNQGRKKGKDK